MRVYLASLAAMLLVLTTVTPASAYSKAALYLIRQQISDACNDSPGKIDPESAIERDLTGDGKADLIINHDGIQCAAPFSRSGYCGIRACSVYVYVREGALLVEKLDILSVSVTIGQGKIPVLTFIPHDMTRKINLRWNGRAFK